MVSLADTKIICSVTMRLDVDLSIDERFFRPEQGARPVAHRFRVSAPTAERRTDIVGDMLREAQSTDFDDIMALYRQLQPNDPTIADGSDRDIFEQILDAEWLHLYVLEQDDATVATAYLSVIPNITRSASPYAVIENVVVREQERGRGHGKTIMAYTLQQAWQMGCYKAMLMTGSRRESTHAFYRSCGFSATEKTGYTARPPR